MKRAKLWTVLTAALLLLAIPMSSMAAPNTITMGQVSEVANLNPLLYPRTPDTNVQCLIFNTLIRPSADLAFEGELAESWDISEDGRLYTFHLVKNAAWHDGTPFTAADVAFTFGSLAHPNYVGGDESRVDAVVGAKEYREGAVTDGVAGIKVIDEYTVSFELIEANASFLAQLYKAVLPKHILSEIDPGQWEKADFNRAPIGTGKYKFVKWEAGQYIELVRNEEYFGVKPSIERVIYKFGDITTLTAALINNEIDVVEAVEPSEIELIEASANAHMVFAPTLNMYYIGLNQLNDHLKDLKVRQALSHALNKPVIVDTVFGEGIAVATDDLFPVTHWSHNPDVTSYPYDPAKAEALLQEAGYAKNSAGIYEKDGKPLHLVFDMVTKGQAAADMAQLIQQAFKAIGVDLEIREQDFATLAFTRLLPSDADKKPRAVTKDDFDMYTLGFGVEVDPDEYRNYFVTASTPPAGMNFITYSNPTVDELFTKSLTLTKQEDREACYKEIAKIFSDDIPWIPLYCNTSLVGVNNRVTDYCTDFRGVSYQIEKWNLAE